MKTAKKTSDKTARRAAVKTPNETPLRRWMVSACGAPAVLVEALAYDHIGGRIHFYDAAGTVANFPEAGTSFRRAQ